MCPRCSRRWNGGAPVSTPDDDLTRAFLDEATDRLDQMDAALLKVETGNAGAETISEFFRHAHTIKGAASMLGLDEVRVLAHAVEDVLATVRDAGTFPEELADPLLRATGALRTLVNGGHDSPDTLMRELAAIRAYPRNAGPAEEPAGPPT